MITITSRGSLDRTMKFLRGAAAGDHFRVLESMGQLGVEALADATPVDSRLTASSWTYSVTKKRGHYTLMWRNTNINDGVPIAILIQYGHGTGTGGWVEGRDYINPAIRPVFDKIADAVWEQVKRG